MDEALRGDEVRHVRKNTFGNFRLDLRSDNHVLIIGKKSECEYKEKHFVFVQQARQPQEPEKSSRNSSENVCSFSWTWVMVATSHDYQSFNSKASSDSK